MDCNEVMDLKTAVMIYRSPRRAIPEDFKFLSSTGVKVKVKVTLLQALMFCTSHVARRGCRGIAVLFHDHGTRRGEGSALHPGRSLPPGKTRYPLYRRLGGPQGRSGQVRKISPPHRDSIPGPSSP
jgi:hypothetical protein